MRTDILRGCLLIQVKKNTYNNNKAKKMIDLKGVSYSILSHVRTVLCKSNSANFVLSCHKFSREISENFVLNYHCQTIFRAKFQGNIAQYFRRTNEKLLF